MYSIEIESQRRFVVAVIVACAPLLMAQTGDVGGSSEKSVDATNIEERMAVWIGAAERFDTSVGPKTISLNADDTPFLHNQVRGRPMVHSIIEGVRLTPDSKNGTVRSKALAFDVYIDADTKRLVKIVSRQPSGIAPPASHVSVEKAELMLSYIGERYEGFPDTPPRIGFVQALQAVRQEGLGDPLIAKEIVGRYVDLARIGASGITRKAVWIINLKGIAAIPSPTGRGPSAKRNQMRHVVDAQTGKWLYATLKP